MDKKTPENPPDDSSSTSPDNSAAYLGILAGVALAFQRGWVGDPAVTTTAPPAVLPTPQTPDMLPKKLVRYRHPCHEHKFFLLVNRFPRSVVCDNIPCGRAIQFSECFASCPRCSIDICAGCFARPLASDQVPVPLADSDSEVNDDTFFTPYRMRAKVEHVKLRGGGRPTANRHTSAQVPTAPQNPAQTDTFAGVRDPNDDEDDPDEEDDDGPDDAEYFPHHH